MLEIKKHKFLETVLSPVGLRDWHGNVRMTKCLNQKFNEMIYKRENETLRRGNIPERHFERYAIASIIENIKTRDAVFMEVGAGYGEWCLAFDGLVRNRIIKTRFVSHLCIGIEPDQTHYEWLCGHFNINHINGKTIKAVISDVNGFLRISTSSDPGYSYDQMILNHGIDKKSLFGAAQWLLGNTVKVRSYTLDELMWPNPSKHIDLIHIDVQGAEDKVIEGASVLIKANEIDYLIIGTHGPEKNEKIKQMLKDKYDFVVDIKPNTIGETSIGKVECQDGILICERKGL